MPERLLARLRVACPAVSKEVFDEIWRRAVVDAEGKVRGAFSSVPGTQQLQEA